MIQNGIRTGAIVQGNIRRGTDLAVRELLKHFDLVFLSTWENEDTALFDHVPRLKVIKSKKPTRSGYSHRNFQRLSTAEGLRAAETARCTHVLKWRTDMLPTKMNVEQLLAKASPPSLNAASRIVTCAFRNLTVMPDWFSSIPDLFAFGTLFDLKILWDDADFSYNLDFNAPTNMIEETSSEWLNRSDISGFYCAETELYAIYKHRIQSLTGRNWLHSEIVTERFCLISEEELGICWFDSQSSFRPIKIALQHPWWTVRTWQKGNPVISAPGYPTRGIFARFRENILTPLVAKRSICKQERWYQSYTAENQSSEPN